MANVGIRKYLNDQGYNDNQIGYNNGQVTLNGKNFYGATPQAADDTSHGMMAGSTYGDRNALSNALKTYQGNDRSTMLNSTLGNVNSAVNTKDPFQFKQTQAPFQYNNPQADPLYQAAMRQATQGAQTATNNAMVGLGSRGIGNSSVAVDRANQIQQKAIGNVNDAVLPQLMQQAYGRYQDQNNNDYRNQMANYGVGQDQVHNQSSFVNTLNGLNQQEADNTYRDNVFGETQKQNNIDLAKWGTSTYGFGAPKSDAGVFFNQYEGAKTLPVQQFEYGQGQDKIQNGISQQNANTSAASVANSNQNAKDRLAWDKDPNNLDNIYKNKQIESMTNKGDQKLQDESKGLVEALRGGQMTPAAAIQQIDEDVKLGFYTAQEASHLKSIITTISPNIPTPANQQQLTPEQQSAIPSESALDKLYKTEGNGAPILDWKSWYKDPKGKSAGVNFATWKQLYGPTIRAK